METTSHTFIVQNNASLPPIEPPSKRSVTAQVEPSSVVTDLAAATTTGTNTDSFYLRMPPTPFETRDQTSFDRSARKRLCSSRAPLQPEITDSSSAGEEVHMASASRLTNTTDAPPVGPPPEFPQRRSHPTTYSKEDLPLIGL